MASLPTVAPLFLLLGMISVCLSFDLTILHTNDIHARFEESNKYGGRCSQSDAEKNNCFGGVARRLTKIHEIRNSNKNVLFLDGGNQFQGTPWFVHYNGTATKYFMQKLGYDAMALGYHEFDNRVEGLVPFLEDPGFSILACNIDTNKEGLIKDGMIQKYTIMEKGGEKIGIIGYVDKSTPRISNPGNNLVFLDEVASVQVQVKILQDMGINKIIALGHAGFDFDIDTKIAAEVVGVDIFVGGHSNTFLYTGTPPSNEVPKGDYPYVVTQANGAKVLFVQAHNVGKYLGFLQVTFDEQGVVTNYSGNPILLDGTVPQDPDLLAEVKTWAKPLEELGKQVIGFTNVFLDNERAVCGRVECNLGNLLTDAVLHTYIKEPQPQSWNQVSIALWNGGSMRTSIAPGNVTMNNILSAMPYRNTVQMVELYGRDLLKVIEKAVTSPGPGGGYLQFSGLIVTYDVAKPEGQRVKDIQVKCTNCTVPEFEPLDQSAVYKVLTSSFLIDGGDGYLIGENMLSRLRIGYLYSDALSSYIMKKSPIIHGLEGRIIAINSTQDKEVIEKPVEKTIGPICNKDSSGSQITYPHLMFIVQLLFIVGLNYWMV